MRPRKRHAVCPDPRVYRSNPRMNSGPRCVVAAQMNPSGRRERPVGLVPLPATDLDLPTLVQHRRPPQRRAGRDRVFEPPASRRGQAVEQVRGERRRIDGRRGQPSPVDAQRSRQLRRCLDGGRHPGHRTDPARRAVGACPAGAAAGLITTTGHDANSTRVRLVEPFNMPEAVSPRCPTTSARAASASGEQRPNGRAADHLPLHRQLRMGHRPRRRARPPTGRRPPPRASPGPRCGGLRRGSRRRRRSTRARRPAARAHESARPAAKASAARPAGEPSTPTTTGPPPGGGTCGVDPLTTATGHRDAVEQRRAREPASMPEPAPSP